jgi:succinyl-diaminopimelate desuccinylase
VNSTLDLARALIARRSVTPEDSGCLDFLATHLAPLGFTCERMDSNGVSNLWARRGRTAPAPLFRGHTDVVPTGPLDLWASDPFEPTLRDGALYGRGASDMKTSIAAFVAALGAFLQRHDDHAGSIALLLTSDEEGPATDGTVKVVEALARAREKPDYCIVGEPTAVQRTGDTIKNGRRGSLSGALVVKGIQGHVAYPHLARNPVHEMSAAIAELAQTEWDRGNEFFPPTTWQISNIHGGHGRGQCHSRRGSRQIQFPFLDREHSRIAPDAHARHTRPARLEYELDWSYDGRPYLTGRGDLVDAVARAIKKETGIDTSFRHQAGLPTAASSPTSVLRS